MSYLNLISKRTTRLNLYSNIEIDKYKDANQYSNYQGNGSNIPMEDLDLISTHFTLRDTKVFRRPQHNSDNNRFSFKWWSHLRPEYQARM